MRKLAAPRWGGRSGFGQVAFVPVGTRVYLLGIPGGRFGPVRLARVERAGLLDAHGYEYWSGSGWTSEQAAAAVVVPAPVGELSCSGARTTGSGS